MLRFILFFLLLSVNSLSLAQELKIGYLNIDHIISSSPQFIQANQLVIKEFQPQENQLKQLAGDIQTQVAEFNQNKDTLDKGTLNQQLKSIARLEKELKTKAGRIKKALQQRNTYELKKIQDLINQAIQQIATDKQYDLILYQEVAYASDKVNITAQVSQKLREMFK